MQHNHLQIISHDLAEVIFESYQYRKILLTHNLQNQIFNTFFIDTYLWSYLS